MVELTIAPCVLIVRPKRRWTGPAVLAVGSVRDVGNPAIAPWRCDSAPDNGSRSRSDRRLEPPWCEIGRRLAPTGQAGSEQLAPAEGRRVAENPARLADIEKGVVSAEVVGNRHAREHLAH